MATLGYLFEFFSTYLSTASVDSLMNGNSISNNNLLEVNPLG